jgi:hypothetical protein
MLWSLTRAAGSSENGIPAAQAHAALGQALPCSKMGNAYGNPAGEIDWTYNYIASRYGNPSNAWAFWNCIGQCESTYKNATW